MKETSPILYHCINLNIARNTGHPFEKNIKDRKGAERVTSAVRATEVVFKERLKVREISSETNIQILMSFKYGTTFQTLEAKSQTPRLI